MLNAAEARAVAWNAAASGTHDVAIVGGGVTGAALFAELSGRGYRVLLAEAGDFASGTSQASGMLVWGGLLYLKNLDWRTVRKLCRDRDRMLAESPDELGVARFRYLPLLRGGRSPRFVRAVLEAYWWLGGRRRSRSEFESEFPEVELLQAGRFGRSLVYEEAALVDSDARLVLDWILAARSERAVAINYCRAAGRFESGAWRLELSGPNDGEQRVAHARVVVNAAGVWADEVAREFGIATRNRHVLSKGVYLGLERSNVHDDCLAFEMGAHGDVQTFTPWGPIALWGPTETALDSIAPGLKPTVDDVRFLVGQARQNLASPVDASSIVSLRCGIRPLAVASSFKRDVYPLDLSRRHAVDVDRARRAITLFGGKLTSARSIAQEARRVIERDVPPNGAACVPTRAGQPRSFRFQAHPETQFVDPVWSRDNESCSTLFDYLRRRTNIAQWTPRLGLGRANEHESALLEISRVFHGEDQAALAVQDLRDRADEQDQLLADL